MFWPLDQQFATKKYFFNTLNFEESPRVFSDAETAGLFDLPVKHLADSFWQGAFVHGCIFIPPFLKKDIQLENVS